MRFYVLDEYSTLMPFGLGISRQNRVVQYRPAAAGVVKPGAITNRVSRLKIILNLWKRAVRRVSTKNTGRLIGRMTRNGRSEVIR
jgi:hypothetical protein